jgi:hypothetical protein
MARPVGHQVAIRPESESAGCPGPGLGRGDWTTGKVKTRRFVESSSDESARLPGRAKRGRAVALGERLAIVHLSRSACGTVGPVRAGPAEPGRAVHPRQPFRGC